MPGFEMEFEVQCPRDGMVTVGLANIEGVRFQDDQRAELAVRCPKCGALITVITQLPADMPSAFMHVMEAISQTMESPFNENRLSALFSQMEGWASSFGFEPEGLEESEPVDLHELDDKEESHIGYFRSELDKMESVDDFLKRIDDK